VVVLADDDDGTTLTSMDTLRQGPMLHFISVVRDVDDFVVVLVLYCGCCVLCFS